MRILTRRKYLRRHNLDIVYEWEDVLSKTCFADFTYANKYGDKLMRLKIPFPWLYGNEITFCFQMHPDSYGRYNSKNVIPLIIDFYIKDPIELNKFYKNYSKCPVVFISSLEVYDFLKKNSCPLPIEHLPLSLSDKYSFQENQEKTKLFDIVWFGRYNPVLYGYLKQYANENPELYYVYRKNKGYYTSRGEYLGELQTRSEYIDLLSKSRIGLYHTPGLDGGEERTHGFNQVTPRFLEMVACGCHVLARYADNPDTRYYQLTDFCPHIDSYEQFKKLVEEKLSQPVNAKFYAQYMNKHYTSTIGTKLSEILKRLEL